jgi:beta-lactamase superfamily II metal-dependent hydrolase
MKRFLTALILALALVSSAVAGKSDGRLDIYWVDVEGGAATLIVTPAGESVLIDTGNPGVRDAERIFETAVKTAGLREINNLIVTHYHRDHFGGASQLAKLIPIRTVYDNASFEGQREFPSQDYKDFKTDKRVQINPGDVLKLAQANGGAAKLVFRCLATRQQVYKSDNTAASSPQPSPGGRGSEVAANECCKDAQQKPIDRSDNANSVVMLLEFGPFRFFDGGDLTWNIEEKLVCPANLVGKVDVYQSTHHGLDQSNNDVLVKSLEPIVAVFNNGSTKGCEPMSFAVLKELPSVKAIYQVHKNLRPDGVKNNAPDEFIANTEKECKGNHIKLSVAPDGKSYTVSVPSTKHEQAYQVRGNN